MTALNPVPQNIPAEAGQRVGAYLRQLSRAVFQLFEQARQFTITRGSGSPEGVLTGNVGDLYLDVNGGASTVFYVKESGTGNTGWVAK